MIRVSLRAPSGALSEVLRTSDPVEAEAHYLSLCRLRFDGPHIVRVVSHSTAVTAGAFRLDRDWPQDELGEPPREQERERFIQIWARPEQGWVGPTAAQFRAALSLAGLSQVGFAREIGVSGRLVRYWAAGDRRPDWPAWALLLSWAGLPLFLHKRG